MSIGLKREELAITRSMILVSRAPKKGPKKGCATFLGGSILSPTAINDDELI